MAIAASSSPDLAPLLQGRRSRQPPEALRPSPGGDGGLRRRKRRHKAVDDAVPDLAFVGDARSLARDVVDELCSSTCKGLLKPAAPVKPKGSMPLTLRFECGSRDADISVRTGDKMYKMRLYAQPEALPKEVDTDEEANEPKPARCRGRATLVAATPWRRIGASGTSRNCGLLLPVAGAESPERPFSHLAVASRRPPPPARASSTMPLPLVDCPSRRGVRRRRCARTGRAERRRRPADASTDGGRTPRRGAWRSASLGGSTGASCRGVRCGGWRAPQLEPRRGGVRVEPAAARAAVAATASRPAAERRAERPAGGSQAAWWPSLARPRRRSHVGGCMGRFWGPVPASINFFERQ